MIFRHQFDQSTTGVLEQHEIFDEVEKSFWFTCPSDDGFQRDNTLFTFAIDLLPLSKMLPFRCHAAYAALTAVGEQDKSVIPEEVRNRALIVSEIIGIRGFQASMGGFEFDEDERETIDEADEVSTSFIHLT